MSGSQNAAVGHIMQTREDFSDNSALHPVALGAGMRAQVNVDSISSFLRVDPVSQKSSSQPESNVDANAGIGPAPQPAPRVYFSGRIRPRATAGLPEAGGSGKISIWKVQLAATGLSENALEEWAISSSFEGPGGISAE